MKYISFIVAAFVLASPALSSAQEVTKVMVDTSVVADNGIGHGSQKMLRSDFGYIDTETLRKIVNYNGRDVIGRIVVQPIQKKQYAPLDRTITDSADSRSVVTRTTKDDGTKKVRTVTTFKRPAANDVEELVEVVTTKPNGVQIFVRKEVVGDIVRATRKMYRNDILTHKLTRINHVTLEDGKKKVTELEKIEHRFDGTAADCFLQDAECNLKDIRTTAKDVNAEQLRNRLQRVYKNSQM